MLSLLPISLFILSHLLTKFSKSVASHKFLLFILYLLLSNNILFIYINYICITIFIYIQYTTLTNHGHYLNKFYFKEIESLSLGL